MGLTEAQIRECSDEELSKLITAELQRFLPYGTDSDLNRFLEDLRKIPVGLRAMAAIHELDVSICLDDLGWHFANWHHRGYCEETLWALRELEATEAAEIFAEAYAFAQPYWDKIGELLKVDFDTFTKWYSDSELEKALDPLTRRMWELYVWGDDKLLNHWVTYARKYPHKVVQ